MLRAPTVQNSATKSLVNTRRHWEAQQHSAGPYESRPLGFTLDIDLGEDAVRSPTGDG